jgi:L-fuculose-phosphate aldolase
MTENALREKIIETAVNMSASGLSPNMSGNVSARLDGGRFLVTPTGAAYQDLTPDEIALVEPDGSFDKGGPTPSSEWRFHSSIYAVRPDIRAVVHAHSDFASAIACARLIIPAFHYMVATCGGADIRCAQYATFGTQELADAAVAALAGRTACLLANHGQIAIGKSLAEAYNRARDVEWLAAAYWRVLQIDGKHILGSDEMARVLKKFETYGDPMGD